MEKKEIIIDENRKIYSSEKYLTTIIEINPSKDNINYFLELYEAIFKEGNEYYKEDKIYALQCSNDKKPEVSYGIIKKIGSDDKFYHLCSTFKSSGGSPLSRLLGGNEMARYNIGTLLKFPIIDFLNDNNLIKIYKEYNDNDFSNLKLISSGSYGDIYSTYSKKDKEEICLKKINIEKMRLNYELNELKDYQQDLNNEINILALLSYNKNSINYFGNYDNRNEKIIIMEKCDNNLKEFLKKRGKALTVEEIRMKFEGINELFKVMQKEKIIHRDLKLENFSIKYNKEKTDYLIKLGDYGIGKFEYKSNGIFSGLKGSIESVSPEIILQKTEKYESSVDMFSLGIILYQLSHNLKHPFGDTYIAFSIKYENNYDKDDLDIEFDKSIKNDDFKDVVKRMIKLNPKNRINWEDYFKHPFFNKNE